MTRAAVMRAVGEALVIENIEVDAPDAFEVVIEVRAAGLCHSDVHFMQGQWGLTLPAVLGHESSGIVVEVGDRVSQVEPGDHVVTCLTVYCGSCDFCAAGRQALCTNRSATDRVRGQPPRLSHNGEALNQYLNLSSFSEQMLVHESAVVKVADELPFEQAALLGCGVTTGLGAVMNTARVRPGETVAVIGCGGVGLSIVQGARIAGASTIVAVDRVGEKLRLARALGATDVIDTSREDAIERVMEITGNGADHAFEAIGIPATAELAFSLIARGGAATIVGVMPAGASIELPTDPLFHDRTIRGSNMGATRAHVDIPRYARMYLDGRLNLDDMVSSRLALEEINRGFDEMLTGRVARNIVVMD